MLHPERGREQTGSRGGQGALHRYPSKSSLTHLTSEALDKKKRRFKEMYLKDTEVVESRKNVNVHTFILLVTQHLRSCSPAYAHGWGGKTSDIKVPRPTHSNLETLVPAPSWAISPARTKLLVPPELRAHPMDSFLSASYFQRTSLLLRYRLQQ